MKQVFGIGLVASVAAYKPEVVSFQAVMDGGASGSIMKGLTGEGMMAVNNIPGFQQLKAETLVSASACAVASQGHEESVSMDFEDGTTRLSLATKKSNGVTHDVIGHNALAAECVAFEKNQAAFRSLVDEAVTGFLEQLDVAQGLHTSSRVLLANEDGTNEISSFSGLGQAGTQLEHFHTYMRSADNEKLRGTPTMDLHVDQGLMIALAPALMIENGKALDGAGHGFLVELTNGEIVEPDFTETDLFFMVGDGAKWVNEKLSKELRPTPHMVTMPTTEGMRSWYGRMVLPPKETFLSTVGSTFGNIQSVTEDSRHLAGAACSYGFELVSRNLQGCAEGEIMCWHQCMAVDCDDAICVYSDGSICVDDHGCDAVCP